jgi:hypothetical protein
MAWLIIVAVASISQPQIATYQCLDDTVFTLSTTDEVAIVRFRDGEYRLPRRRSSIAIKYATEEATLYLDGDFAAFASNERPLPGCYKLGSDKRPVP